MNATTRVGCALVLGVSLLLIAGPVCAQTGPPEQMPKPYRTLFGGDDVRLPSLHALDLTLTLDSGLDDGMYGLNARPVDGSAPVSTGFQEIYAGTAELAYTRRGRQFRSELRGLASLPYYSLFPDEPLTAAYGGRGSVSFLSTRTSVNAFGNYLHSPYYAGALDPSTGPGIGNGYFGRMSALNPNNEATAGAGLTYKIGRRTSTILGYSYYSTDFTEEVRWNRSQGVDASLERQLSRGVAITGAYWYRTGDYTTGDIVTDADSHDVSVAFAYTRRGPRGKTSLFRAKVGYSIVDDTGRHYEGWPWSVHVDHAVGTRWSLAADYSRSLQYYSTVQRPLWSDMVTIAATGYVNARVKLGFDGNYWTGQRVFDVGREYDTYWTTARIQVALVQWAAITAGYSYYRYDYPPGYILPAGMPHELNRQRVQLGASFWLPLARGGRGGAGRIPDNQ